MRSFARRWLMTAGVLAIGTVLFSLPAESAKGEKADAGWVQLFNGKDLTGWQISDPPGGQFDKATFQKNADGKSVAIVAHEKKSGKDITVWRVEDGLLIGGGPMTHIYTNGGDYDNFRFRVTAKLNDGGNSGMFFRAGLRPGVPKGYEAQLNATHGDPIKTGSLYPNGEFGLNKYGTVFQVRDKAPHGPDEFFTQEVIADGPKITILVNGKKMIEWTDPENRFTKGHFALQGHDPGSIMTFKTVEYQPLKK
ncbi:MAG: DUF1080 domain-containing protein [Bacteroidales bacterium]|nr:DUF1080 domain-containing protein [Bacteroidales bacterium]